MNTPSIGLLAAALLAGAAPAPASLPLQQALIGAPGCEHVLDLLLRYGPLEGAGDLQGGAVAPGPHGPVVVPAAEYGDLCLANLAEVAGDPACPPTFCVAVTNNSNRSVCDVSVSLVALLGPIKASDPTATAQIAEIPAGATVEVEISLPAEALAMGSNGGTIVGFQKLLVAVDALDAYAELNEANNLRLVCRADIPQKVIEVAAPLAPADSLSPAAPVAPVNPAPSTIDSALEQFGLDTQGEEAALRL